MRRGAAILLLGIVLSGCRHYYQPLSQCQSFIADGADSAAESVRVQYLGVGGFLVEYGDDVILTAPLYSNPSILEVAADHAIRPDGTQIEALLPEPASRASAILVGHAHYDHLLDVPYVATRLARSALIYGSRTTELLLDAVSPGLGARVRVLNPDAGSNEAAGVWLEAGERIRVMAIRSEHSTQVTLDVSDGFLKTRPLPFHLWRGTLTAPPAPPRSASDWPEGTVFAFVVDLLDAPGGEPVFRIYYQDSGTNEPIGYPPESLIDGRPVDLAILCVGGDFQRLKRHPEGIIARTKARWVVLSHWEDFFVPQTEYSKDRGIYGIASAGLLEEVDTKRFLGRARRAAKAQGGEAFVPCPTVSSFKFPVGGP